MKKLNLLFFLVVISSFILQAQSSYDVQSFTHLKVNDFIPGTHPDFYPMLQNMPAPSPGGHSYNSFLIRQKEINAANFVPEAQEKSSHSSAALAAKPLLGRNFLGNVFDDGVPCDNNIAVSNGGKIISVMNSTMYIYGSAADTPLVASSLEAFTDTTLHATANKYDPKVTYDPKRDKFILVYLCGTASTNNYIMVAFSETNDPQGVWHQYALQGNPFSNGTWSDYPSIAQSDDELFITVNLIKDDSTWQAGFTESVVWQLDKSNGYSGATMTSRLWHNIMFAGQKVRNICPIQGGSTTYGPNMFLASDRNFDNSNDTFLVAEITNKQGASPVLNVHAVLSDHNYGLPPHGLQRINLFLQTNDARVLGGYYENDQLVLVGNSIIPSTGKAGCFHAIIDAPRSASTGRLHVVGDTLFDFGYPNIAYTGRYVGDDQCIISFDHTAKDSFPGMSAVFYERYAGYSDRLQVKRGVNWVNILAGNEERWGDYSGAQRKYNQPGTVWVAGFYGIRVSSGAGFANANNAWVAELTSPYSVGAGVNQIERKEVQAIVSPNPANERIAISFELEEKEMIEINLYDMQGKVLLREMYHDLAKSGESRYSFNTIALPNGTYVIKVMTEKGELAAKKFIVQH